MPNERPSEQDACQLKAGHAPAVKVGNMRVVQRTHSTSSTHSDKGDANEQSSDSTVPTACSFAPKTVIKTATSGVADTVVQSQPEAVKQFHEKPQVTHEYRGHSNKPNHIQQPNKKN